MADKAPETTEFQIFKLKVYLSYRFMISKKHFNCKPIELFYLLLSLDRNVYT